MPDIMERVITAATLRTAIRNKIRAGVSGRSISILINRHAPADAHSEREDASGVQRLAVEVIPHGQRAAFLEALDHLSDDAPAVKPAVARLAG
ncbi:MAG: hypothetical protein JO032_21065 [Alphaproteobacteria bacterium]|nr:hypothetical protein [Alphaproteobacteria bacterium]